MGNKPLVAFRKSTDQDIPYFKEWLLQPGVLEGFPMTDVREIDDAIRIWKMYLKKGTSITALYKKKPCGAANLYINEIEKMRHQSLFVIIVDEKVRNQGIGALLMKELMQLAKETFHIEILHLEVYEHNPAYNLYQRMGFEECGRHSKYLKGTDGRYFDKIFMQKIL